MSAIKFLTTRWCAIDTKSGARLVVELVHDHRGTGWVWHVSVPLFDDKDLSCARGAGEGRCSDDRVAKREALDALERSLRLFPQSKR